METLILADLTPIEILEKVNAFYDTSFNRLLWVIGVGFALVGIAMPILLQWLQTRTLKINEAKLEDNLRTYVDGLKTWANS